MGYKARVNQKTLEWHNGNGANTTILPSSFCKTTVVAAENNATKKSKTKVLTTLLRRYSAINASFKILRVSEVSEPFQVVVNILEVMTIDKGAES
jgi:hypothetical protein